MSRSIYYDSDFSSDRSFYEESRYHQAGIRYSRSPVRRNSVVVRDRVRVEDGQQARREGSGNVRKEKQEAGRGPLKLQSHLVLERSDDFYDREFPKLSSKQHFDDNDTGVVVKRFVSFYFTNVPEFIPYVYLRQGFEVCGILEDLYVAKNYNAQGKVYGFVRFGKVKNVAKLTKALNEVSFL